MAVARGARLFPPLALFLIAFLARLAAIGRYVTPDELNWVYRSLGLRRALLAGDWQHTLQSGHPGVTTTWIGAIAAQIQLWMQPELRARLAWLHRLQQLSTDNVEAYRHLYAFLDGGRLALALALSLALVLVYLLARDLLGARAAFLGALLLALDPFYAGLSGLLHVDALLATCTLLALLFSLHAAQDASSWRMAAGAGIFTSLAVLTKTPGLILLAFVPAILLWPALHNPRPAGISAPLGAADVRQRRRLAQVFIWGATTLLVALLLLPALWAAPRAVVELVGGLSGRLIDEAVRPTFFMGEMALVHGPLFYPLAVLFRLSPLTFVGLALALPALLRRRQTQTLNARWLLLFAVAFLLAISLAAKKFDRYALPSLAVLGLLGGWGLVQAAGWLRDSRRRIWLTALLLQAAFFLSTWPHPLTAANWLLGGNAVARHVLPSGWGEDAGLAARALSASLQQPVEATLFTSSLTGTAPFFPGEIIRLRTPNLTRLEPQHFLLTLPQDRQSPAASAPQAAPTVVPVKGAGNALLQTGLDASDLQLPAFTFEPRGARFGDALQLRAAGSAFLPWPEETLVGLTWQRLQANQPAPAYRLQLALVDEAGRQWLQREVPLLNASDHAPADWAGGAPQTVFYTVQLPATLAPGDYAWVARLFDDQGRQQAVFDLSGAFAGTQSTVAGIVVTPPPSQPVVEVPQPLAADGPLAGHGGLPAAATAGDPFSMDLWLRAPQPTQDTTHYTVVLHIDGMQRAYALDTAGWRPGQVYRVRPIWRLPLQLIPGEHAVALSLREGNGAGAIAGPLLLGSLKIETRERLFELPPESDALQLSVGDLALLQDVTIEVQEQALLVHVSWQARQATFESFTTFVHLRDGERVVGGDDRPPSPPTNSWAPGEVIRETYTLPRPAAGTYAVALGLYDASNGARLPLRDAEGQALTDDQFLQPVVIAP